MEIAAFPSNLSWELANVADDRELFTPEYFETLWSRRRSPSKNDSQASQKDPGRRRGWRLGRRGESE